MYPGSRRERSARERTGDTGGAGQKTERQALNPRENRAMPEDRRLASSVAASPVAISGRLAPTLYAWFPDSPGHSDSSFHIRGNRERQVTIKSKRTRRVPLFERAFEIVMSQQRISKSRHVFVQYGARVRKEKHFQAPFSRHEVSRAFHSVADAMGLPADAVLHSTRRTTLSELGAARSGRSHHSVDLRARRYPDLAAIFAPHAGERCAGV
jgi:hypothetical protein